MPALERKAHVGNQDQETAKNRSGIILAEQYFGKSTQMHKSRKHMKNLIDFIEKEHAVAVTCQRSGAKNCHSRLNQGIEVEKMKNKNESGFSLIELLLVVVIIGIIAALAVPALQKAIRAAENGTTFATMRTISSTQMSFLTQNNRFGRLAEINNILGNGIGTPSGSEINRGKYVFAMVPATPTDLELRQEYTVTATRTIASEGITYQYELTQSGEIRQVLPAPAPTP